MLSSRRNTTHAARDRDEKTVALNLSTTTQWRCFWPLLSRIVQLLAKKKKAKVSVINRALVARKISVQRFYARNREREREREHARALSLLSLSLPSTLLLSRPPVVSRRKKTEDGEETREVKKRRTKTNRHAQKKNLKP